MDFLNLIEADIDTTFSLTRIDIYNWGSFSGYHTAEIDPLGTAIIGPTGSGKTTIIDAFMTLLTANPKYNLASTGGHESDRSLMSYIRGVSGTGNETDDSHVLRTGKTTTGIGATFSNGEDTIQINAIFWINSASHSASDRYDVWIIDENPSKTLKGWLLEHEENGIKGLKQLERETPNLRVNSKSKKKYLADLRRIFEVSENAFTLLNRTAGLKQINSVDEVFREFVLDDRSAFDRAEEVVKEFDNLAAIYQELELARRQQASLIPIENTNSKHQKMNSKLKAQEQLLDILPRWFATLGGEIWKKEANRLRERKTFVDGELSKLNIEKEGLKEKIETLKMRYYQSGGSDIESLKKLIAQQEKALQERKNYEGQYKVLLSSLNRDQEVTKEKFNQNKEWASDQVRLLTAEKEVKWREVIASQAKVTQKRNDMEAISGELAKVRKRPGSNIRADYQDFRSKLAEELGLDVDDLPFVAELVQVKEEESEWRGAIERAIGNHRLRVLVPSRYIDQALKWVNLRDNKLHVRLSEAKKDNGKIEFKRDGYTRKLNFKDHPLRESVKSLLAKYDLSCVSTPEELRFTTHAITVQGLMSGQKGMFEKKDQSFLNRDWMTGFDNKDLLVSLNQELTEAKEELAGLESEHSKKMSAHKEIDDKQLLLNKLAELNFDQIDSKEVQKELDLSMEKYNSLLSPESDIAKTLKEKEQVKEILESVEGQVKKQEEESIRLEVRLETAVKKQDSANERKQGGLNEEENILAREDLPLLDINQIEELDGVERKTRIKLTNERDQSNEQLKKLEKDLVKFMTTAKNVDIGYLTETGTEVQDAPEYLERLRVLNEEALPEKLNDFRSYLNQSSDQGVTQLLTNIENEVSIIEERIDDLNTTLRRVDYEPGGHLQLKPLHIKHRSLSDLIEEQKRLRQEELKDDDGEGQYRALESIVNILREATINKRTVGARTLLDPRYRLRFLIHVVENETQKVIEVRQGSQSGSGGEKEVIANYILIASLSYALCPPGATRPLFNTILLDEAFSKTSQKRAARIVSTIREFNLHPLFLTPNKEMRLLRNHTRSAILAHRKGSKATLTTLSWEELEKYASNTLGKSKGKEAQFKVNR